jgi:hypothetical protein
MHENIVTGGLTRLSMGTNCEGITGLLQHINKLASNKTYCLEKGGGAGGSYVNDNETDGLR